MFSGEGKHPLGNWAQPVTEEIWPPACRRPPGRIPQASGSPPSALPRLHVLASLSVPSTQGTMAYNTPLIGNLHEHTNMSLSKGFVKRQGKWVVGELHALLAKLQQESYETYLFQTGTHTRFGLRPSVRGARSSFQKCSMVHSP